MTAKLNPVPALEHTPSPVKCVFCSEFLPFRECIIYDVNRFLLYEFSVEKSLYSTELLLLCCQWEWADRNPLPAFEISIYFDF